jgi:16S rRNA (guanine527-N7)-methyltransferase
LCVSRAVANLSSLSEYCLPFVKKGGQFISYKSSDIDKELLSSKHAISVLGGEIEDIIKFKLPNTDIDRSLILINKVNETNRKYPRKAGMPTKEPL